MNKGDLINKIAQSAGLTKNQAAAALGATLEGIQESLQSGESVTLIGFGTFAVKHRAERNGKNPAKPNTPIVIPARNVVSFKAGKTLSESVR